MVELKSVKTASVINPGVVYCGDSMDLLEGIKNFSVDLILTDPPYGIDFQSNMPVEGSEKPRIHNDKMEDTMKLLRAFLKHSSRVLVEGGVLCMFCSGGSPRSVLGRIEDMIDDLPSLTKENVLVWDRLDMGLGWRYRPQWESIIVAYKGDTRRCWNGAPTQTNVLRYPRIIPKAGEHPTPKPQDLITRLLLDNSMEGDLVLDPFCGSGTTPFCCEREKRHWIACDLEPRYAEMTAKRVRAEQSQLKLF